MLNLDAFEPSENMTLAIILHILKINGLVIIALKLLLLFFIDSLHFSTTSYLSIALPTTNWLRNNKWFLHIS